MILSRTIGWVGQMGEKESWIRFHKECEGLFRMFVVRPDQPAPPECKARYDAALEWWVKRIFAEERPLCIACEHEFTTDRQTGPRAMLVIEPSRDDAGTMVLPGICQRCAKRTDTELIEVAFKDLKEMGIADRNLGPLGPGGTE